MFGKKQPLARKKFKTTLEGSRLGDVEQRRFSDPLHWGGHSKRSLKKNDGTPKKVKPSLCFGPGHILRRPCHICASWEKQRKKKGGGKKVGGDENDGGGRLNSAPSHLLLKWRKKQIGCGRNQGTKKTGVVARVATTDENLKKSLQKGGRNVELPSGFEKKERRNRDQNRKKRLKRMGANWN